MPERAASASWAIRERASQRTTCACCASFAPHYGRAPDAAALEAAAEARLLAQLSGERIREELLRLLPQRIRSQPFN